MKTFVVEYFNSTQIEELMSKIEALRKEGNIYQIANMTAKLYECIVSSAQVSLDYERAPISFELIKRYGSFYKYSALNEMYRMIKKMLDENIALDETCVMYFYNQTKKFGNYVSSFVCLNLGLQVTTTSVPMLQIQEMMKIFSERRTDNCMETINFTLSLQGEYSLKSGALMDSSDKFMEFLVDDIRFTFTFNLNGDNYERLHIHDDKSVDRINYGGIQVCFPLSKRIQKDLHTMITNIISDDKQKFKSHGKCQELTCYKDYSNTDARNSKSKKLNGGE